MSDFGDYARAFGVTRDEVEADLADAGARYHWSEAAAEPGIVALHLSRPATPRTPFRTR